MINEQIENAKNENNAYGLMVTQCKSKVKVITQKINTKRATLSRLRDTNKYVNAWVLGFSKEEIQTFALKSTIDELNTKIQYVSDLLTDGLIEIRLLTEKTLKSGKIKSIFELSISDLNKKNLPFKEWSKGQKKRIEIIMSFALMNLEENILSEVWLDELFDGVDRVGIGKILNLLAKESYDGKRFIVMSHSNDVKSLFQNKGIVTLKNGESTFSIK
jgi:hypothetical protein